MRFLTLLLLALATSASAAETVLPLWPEGVPGKRVEPSKSLLDRIGPETALWSSDYPHQESTFGYTRSSIQAVFDATSVNVCSVPGLSPTATPVTTCDTHPAGSTLNLATVPLNGPVTGDSR